MPGVVFTSSAYGCPVSVTMKSIRAEPRQPRPSHSVGSTGWDRSSAWTCDFSSTHSTTARSGKLIRRGVHTFVQALENDIRTWIQTWNEDPHPFTWTKTADEILKSLADYLSKITPPGTKKTTSI
jgi:hypothetical protein